MKGDQSRYIFLDSRVSTRGDRAHISLPRSAFHAGPSDRMSLTLVNFSMRRNFYNIHQYNQKFYLIHKNLDVDSAQNNTVTRLEVNILPGSYQTHDKLAIAIQSSLRATILAGGNSVAESIDSTNCTVTFDAETRKMLIKIRFKTTIHLPSGPTYNHVNDDLSIRTYNIDPYDNSINGLNETGAKNNSYIILGSVPIKNTQEDKESFIKETSGSDKTFESKYPSSLSTNESLYIRFPTLEMQNYSSSSYDPNNSENNKILESNLFARIMIPSSTYDEEHELIQWEDPGNDLFSVTLGRKNLESLSIQITDAYSNLLSEVHPGQSEDGLLSFRCVLRWDLFKGKEPEVPISHIVKHDQIEKTGYFDRPVQSFKNPCP